MALSHSFTSIVLSSCTPSGTPGKARSAVVAVGGSELDLAIALAFDGITGQVEPQRVDVLLDELQGAQLPMTSML